jgi:hypothetical protein
MNTKKKTATEQYQQTKAESRRKMKRRPHTQERHKQPHEQERIETRMFD